MTTLPFHPSSSSKPTASGSHSVPDVRTDHWIDPLSDGTHVLIRPLEEKDREREFEFIRNLSPESRHYRFLVTMKEPGERLLDQMMDIDYQQRMAYVALRIDDSVLTEVGVARYASMDTNGKCESAVVVADHWQRKGVGTQLMKHLIDAARINGFEQMISMDAAVNSHMRHLAKSLGFVSRQDPDDTTQVIYRLKLK